ncbi:MAG: CapA family protein [Candidatus Odinarchaeota archaeon]
MKITYYNDKSIYKGGTDDVKLIVSGDFCLDGRVEKLCSSNREGEIFGEFKEQLINKDISIINIECPLTIDHTPISKEGPNLIADPVCVKALTAIDLDIAALANNHIMDQGVKGLKSTLNHLKKNKIHTVGVGENIHESQKPLRIEKKGCRISFLNIAEQEFSSATEKTAGAAKIDVIDNYYRITEEKNNADFIILIIHGGNEFYSLPSPDMVKLCRFYAQLGVSAIFSHHTHCFSGYEIYNNVPIFYGLGNFIFDRPNEKRKVWNSGYFVKLLLYKGTIKEIILFPYMQFYDRVGLRKLNSQELDEFQKNFAQLNEAISSQEELLKEWNNFIRIKRNKYFTDLLSLNLIQRALIKYNILNKWILKDKRLRILLNLFRCLSHREATIGVLKKELKID